MKKKINIENYEAYLLDLSEGNISDADRAELMLFLNEHPEIDWDTDDLPIIEDKPSELNEVSKADLFRNEESGLSQKDHLLISSIEKTLDPSETEELSKLLEADPELLKDLAAYQKTILPTIEVSFERKDELIKKEGRVIYFWASAASIAAAILALFLFNLPNEKYNPRTKGFVESTMADSKVGFSFEVEDDVNDQKEKKIIRVEPVEAEMDQLAEEKAPKTEEVELEKPQPIPPIEENAPQLAEVNVKKEGKVEEPEASPVEEESITVPDLAEKNSEPKAEAPKDTKPNKVYTPIEFAKKVVKEDVLNNKSLPKALMDEVADLTNDKVKLEKEKDSPQFALNIGKLKINKK